MMHNTQPLKTAHELSLSTLVADPTPVSPVLDKQAQATVHVQRRMKRLLFGMNDTDPHVSCRHNNACNSTIQMCLQCTSCMSDNKQITAAAGL